MINFIQARTSLLLALLSLSLGCANPCFPDENNALIPRNVLFQPSLRYEPEISPNGKVVAYLAPTITIWTTKQIGSSGPLNIWLRDVGKDKERAITNEEQNVDEFFIQKDSKHIIYRLQPQGLNKGPLFQVDINTGTTRNLTPWTGVSVEDCHYDWRSPGELLVALKLPKADHSDVYRVNLDSGTIVLEEKHEAHVLEEFSDGWIPDKQLVVRAKQVLNNDGLEELWVRKDRKAPWHLVKRFERGDYVSTSGFTSDGKSLLVYTALGLDARSLAAIDVDSGAISVLARDNRSDVCKFIAQDDIPMGVQFESDHIFWKPLSNRFKAVLDAARKLGNGDFDFPSYDSTRTNYIISLTRDDGPISYYLFNTLTKQTSFLFYDRPDLKRYKFATMTPISFVTRDGMKEHGYLTLPNVIQPHKLPLVLFVHGGPSVRDSWGFDSLTQWLANRGYAVLQVNFRGSGGCGRTLLEAGMRQWGRKMNDDLIDAKRWAVAQGIADPNRVAICGTSYGGYAVLAALAFTPDEFRCGIDVAGISSLVTKLEAEHTNFHDCTVDYTEMQLGKLGENDLQLRAQSPLYSVSQIRAPLLIAHGTADTVVKISESEQFVEALKKHGKSYSYYPVPDGEHSWPSDEEFNLQAEQFLSKHLGGRFEPRVSLLAKVKAAVDLVLGLQSAFGQAR